VVNLHRSRQHAHHSACRYACLTGVCFISYSFFSYLLFSFYINQYFFQKIQLLGQLSTCTARGNMLTILKCTVAAAAAAGDVTIRPGHPLT
jgi:hypothetical protein